MSRETKLQTLPNISLDNAAKACGQRKEDARYRYCVMVIVPPRNQCKFWISIPEGFHALITSAGSFIGIWSSGFHLAKPWERVSHLVTKQYVVYDTPVKECPTADNVFVEIDVNTVFSVKDDPVQIRKFVYKLGPERLQDMLKALQEEAVRGMARQKKYTDIYDLMDTQELEVFEEKKDALPAGQMEAEPIDFDDDEDDSGKPKQEEKTRKLSSGEALQQQLSKTKDEMNEKLGHYGIEIYSITITDVRLPDDFCSQMEEATTFHSKNIEQESKQKYDLMVIENSEQRNKANQSLEEKKEEAVVKKDQRAATEEKITESFRAETASLIAVIQEDMKAEIRDISTTSALTVAELNAQKDEELAAIRANADGQVANITAEMEGFVVEKNALTRMQVAQLQAQENLLLAQAEKIMGQKMVSKRDYDAKMSNLVVLDKLSNNRNAVMSGTTPNDRDSTMATLLGAKNAANVLKL